MLLDYVRLTIVLASSSSKARDGTQPQLIWIANGFLKQIEGWKDSTGIKAFALHLQDQLQSLPWHIFPLHYHFTPAVPGVILEKREKSSSWALPGLVPKLQKQKKTENKTISTTKKSGIMWLYGPESLSFPLMISYHCPAFSFSLHFLHIC